MIMSDSIVRFYASIFTLTSFPAHAISSSQHTRFTRCPHIPLPLVVTCVAAIGRKSELSGGLARRNSCGGKLCAESELECSRRVSLSCPVPQRLAEGARLADPPAPMAQQLTALLMGDNGRVSMRHACGSAASPLCGGVETIILGIDH